MERHLFVSGSESDLKETSLSSHLTHSTKVYRKKIAFVILLLSDENHALAHLYNFDHPDALDFDLAFEKINELLSGKDC